MRADALRKRRPASVDVAAVKPRRVTWGDGWSWSLGRARARQRVDLPGDTQSRAHGRDEGDALKRGDDVVLAVYPLRSLALVIWPSARDYRPSRDIHDSLMKWSVVNIPRRSIAYALFAAYSLWCAFRVSSGEGGSFQQSTALIPPSESELKGIFHSARTQQPHPRRTNTTGEAL
jgi:hypothetical protein